MILRTCGLLILMAAAAGCSTAIDLTDTPEPIRPFAASSLDEPTALPPGVDLMPLRVGRWVYKHIGGDDAEPFVQRIEPAGNGSAPFRRHDEALGQVNHVSRDGRGRILLHAVEDHEHKVITRFARPLVVCDPSITPGQVITTDTEITIANLKTPGKVKDRGPCAMELRYVGRQRLRTPAGEFDCYILQRNYRMKISKASVSSETVIWCADGAGIQARLYKESGRALMLLSWFNRHEVVLVESPAKN